jgi:hypothetical protein
MGDRCGAAAALERVMRDAPSRHDALHAVASVLSGHMFDMMRGDESGDYERELRKLTWRRFVREMS